MSEQSVEMIIAVTIHGDAVIVSAPEAFSLCFESHYCSDSNFHNVPTEPGIYRCQVEDRTTYDTGNGDEYEERFEILNTQSISLEVAHPA